MMLWFGREPAQYLGVFTAAVALFSAIVLPLSVEVQGALIAVVTVGVGFVEAALVSAEKAAPIAAGFVQAILALTLALGLHLSPETQGSIMAFVSAGVALYLRTQVSAPVAANGARVAPVTNTTHTPTT